MYETQLKTSQFGDTGLEITRVGFGAWAIGGGGWEFGWGPQQDEESIAAIHRAGDLGRSPGRCGILRRTARSPDSADPARWTLSWPRRAPPPPTGAAARGVGRPPGRHPPPLQGPGP